tara:strand:+ start:789 stop:968 length:180 start_codon:yes stop_codon:yes gene_type:complete
MIYLKNQLAVTATTNRFRFASALFVSITRAFVISTICTFAFWIIASHERNIIVDNKNTR